MKKILKEVIEDQQNRKNSEDFVGRYFPETMLKNEKIIVISGIRRCGKSVLLQQIREKNSQKDYYLNFDDDRLVNFNVSHFQDLYELFIELFGEQNIFYFDEIQNIEGWERFVRRLYDDGKKVFVTGSNAKMLSRELGTHLTGRYQSFELFPFSFQEYLIMNKIEINHSQIVGTVNRAKYKAYCADYLHKGGFPSFLKYNDDLFLKALYDSILYKDVMVRNKITNEKELLDLVYFMMSNIGKPISFTSLCKIIGVKNPTTVKNYLEFIENTYLIMSISKFDYSMKKQILNPKKYYGIDNAMVQKLGFHFSKEQGRLLENLVFLELQRKGKNIYYHQTKKECDFVIKEGLTITEAIQVCYNFENQEVRDREIAGLMEALETYNLDFGTIVTLDNEQIINGNDKTIKVIPLYQFLLM